MGSAYEMGVTEATAPQGAAALGLSVHGRASEAGTGEHVLCRYRKCPESRNSSGAAAGAPTQPRPSGSDDYFRAKAGCGLSGTSSVVPPAGTTTSMNTATTAGSN